MAEIDDIINEPSESQKRINELSGKVKKADEERESERQAREAAEAKAAEATKLAEFAEGFVDIVANNPAAKDHKDEIKQKVLSGYTMEDATFAVLGKAGKLGAQEDTSSSPAGGSAVTNAPQGGTKSVTEMTQEERRSELLKAQERGDIYLS